MTAKFSTNFACRKCKANFVDAVERKKSNLMKWKKLERFNI